VVTSEAGTVVVVVVVVEVVDAGSSSPVASPPIVQLCTATLVPGPLALTTSSTAVP
jgi:hypothetical protein